MVIHAVCESDELRIVNSHLEHKLRTCTILFHNMHNENTGN